MKLFRYYLFIALAAVPASAAAQENSAPAKVYGYEDGTADNYLEPAEYAVYYKRSQLVTDSQTKAQSCQIDTLALIIGRRWSVFYNTEYDKRFSAWGRQNLKKSRQVTKPISLQAVPLSSVVDKKNASSDYYECNLGESELIYIDRIGKKTYSCINAPERIMNLQKSKTSLEWNLCDAQDTVLSYPCKRAEVLYSGRNYSAWYTTDIPIPVGPWKFYGLPGLILKIEDKEGCFKFEALGMETLDKPSYISIDDNLEKVSLKYFNKVANDQRSIRRGSFLFEGELIYTETRPYIYYNMELSDE